MSAAPDVAVASKNGDRPVARVAPRIAGSASRATTVLTRLSGLSRRGRLSARRAGRERAVPASAVSPMMKRSTLGRARPPLGDGPHDEALAPGHVAAHEHPFAIGLPVRVAGHVAPGVELEAELVHHPAAFGAEEAHGQQHELARQLEFAARRPARTPGGPPSSRTSTRWPARARTAPLPSSTNRGGGHAVDPVATLLVGRGGPEDERPRRPGVVVEPGVGGPGQDLELVDRATPPGGGRCPGSRRRCRRRR